MGKAVGKPIYKLLGGRRERVKAYHTTGGVDDVDRQVEYALAAQQAGFRGYKLHPKAGYDGDLAQCRAVREAVGAGMVLMSDPVAAYNHQPATNPNCAATPTPKPSTPATCRLYPLDRPLPIRPR